METCGGCDDRVAIMDQLGIQWCSDNVDQIVGWLKDEAAARGLPFVEFLANLLIRRAIREPSKRSGLSITSTATRAAVEG